MRPVRQCPTYQPNRKRDKYQTKDLPHGRLFRFSWLERFGGGAEEPGVDLLVYERLRGGLVVGVWCVEVSEWGGEVCQSDADGLHRCNRALSHVPRTRTCRDERKPVSALSLRFAMR